MNAPNKNQVFKIIRCHTERHLAADCGDQARRKEPQEKRTAIPASAEKTAKEATDAATPAEAPTGQSRGDD